MDTTKLKRQLRAYWVNDIHAIVDDALRPTPVSSGGGGSTGGTYTQGAGIDIVGDVISVDVTDIINTSYGLSEVANRMRVAVGGSGGLEFDGSGALQLADTVAGAGLAISSKVLAVNVGDGLEIDSDAVEVDLSATSGLEFSSGDLQIADSIAGAGLSITSKVLAVVVGSGLEIDTDTVKVDLAAPSGLEFDSGDLAIADQIAGAGISITDKVLAVELDTDSGLELGAGDEGALAMGEPTTLAVGTTNSVTTTTHAHAITSTADGAANHSTILQSGTSGELKLDYLTVTDIYADSYIEIQPTGDIILDPGGNDVLPGSTVADDLGDYNRMWRTLFAAELYVETLVAQDVMATLGGRIMVAPTTTLIADVDSLDTSIDVKHNNLNNGDYVMLKAAPGGMAQFEIMEITSAAGAITGGYRYSVNRDEDGSGATDWYTGDAVASLGNSAGEGYIELTSTETVHQDLGPNITIYSRTGTSTWDQVKPVATWGNLESFVDYGSAEFGFAVANDLALTPTTGLQGITADRTDGIRLFNTDMALYDGSAMRVQLTNDGDVIFGYDAETEADRTFRHDGGSGDIFIGKTTAGHMWWDYSAGRLYLRDGATSTNRGYLDTDGRLTFGADKVWFDELGVSFDAGSAVAADTNAICWVHDGDNTTRIYSLYAGDGSTDLTIESGGMDGLAVDGTIYIAAYNESGVLCGWMQAGELGVSLSDGTGATPVVQVASTGIVGTGTLNVTGAVDFDSTLNVDGVATMNNNVVVNGGRIQALDYNDAVYYIADQNATYCSDGGIVIRPNSNPASGSPLFNVMSAAGTERLRVEHDGAVEITNSLALTGSMTATGSVAADSSVSAGTSLTAATHVYIGNGGGNDYLYFRNNANDAWINAMYVNSLDDLIIGLTVDTGDEIVLRNSGGSKFRVSNDYLEADVPLRIDGGDTVTSNPTAAASTQGWKVSLYSTTTALGVAQNTLALKSGNWVAAFDAANPAGDATATEPDSNACFAVNDAYLWTEADLGQAWTAPTYLNSWSIYNYGSFSAVPLGYKKFGDQVFLKGVVEWNNGAVEAHGTKIFTLPAGYRPSQETLLATTCRDDNAGNDVPARIHIETDGDVVFYASGGGYDDPPDDGNYVILSGLSFFV